MAMIADKGDTMTLTEATKEKIAALNPAIFAFWVPDEFIPADGNFQLSLLDNQSIIHILEELEEGSSDDVLCWCSCTPKVKAGSYDAKHLEGCKLFEHKAWCARQCEWIPWLHAFVYVGEEHLIGAGHPAVKAKVGDVVPFVSKKSKKGKHHQQNSKHTPPKTVTTTYVPKCRHYGESVTMPDGTVIGVSSHFSRLATDTIPDFGVYLASSWSPKNYLSYALPWQDFGLPGVPDHVVEGVVDEILYRARLGQHVEIGCIGGHGRTGSLLALILQRAGLEDPYEATEWVRTNYCDHAIESADQEWYVKKFAAALVGDPIPARPQKAPPAPKATPAGATGATGSYSTVPKAKVSADKQEELFARYGKIDDNDRAMAKHRPLDQKCPVCGETERDISSGYSCSNSGCELFWVRISQRDKYVSDLDDWDLMVHWGISAEDLADHDHDQDFAKAKAMYADAMEQMGFDDLPDEPTDPDELADMHATLKELYCGDDYMMGGWFG